MTYRIRPYTQALALGARAVFLGRPVLWGLAHSGEEGVFNVLKLLNDEFVLAMKLAGCVKVAVRTVPYIVCMYVLCNCVCMHNVTVA